MSKTWLITGGGGFIGRHLSHFILTRHPDDNVIASDIHFPEKSQCPDWYQSLLSEGRLQQINADVRVPMDWEKLPNKVDVTVHLAAIHREPGHEPQEYFETNVLGAENLIEWIKKTHCKKLVFTSSIAVYGNTRNGVDEYSLPMPETPYGISKLLSEKVFNAWQKEDKTNSLIIIRPAVIFGQGEAGNVSRLVKALLRRRFVYMGNHNVQKACGYVRDLCHCVEWLLLRTEKDAANVITTNFCLPKPPTLQDYVQAIGRVSGKSLRVPSVPYTLVLAAAYCLSPFLKLAKLKTDIHPRRIKKLLWPTQVSSTYLVDNEYPFQYNLQTALLDWKIQSEEEWQ